MPCRSSVTNTSRDARASGWQRIAPCDVCRTSTRQLALTQAQLLLNDTWVQEQAAALSDRAKKEAGSSIRDRLRRLWYLAVQREPIEEEIEEATCYLGNTPDDDIRELRWTRPCRTLVNSSEFLCIQ